MLLTTLRICADADGEAAIKDKMADPLVQELVQKAVVEALEIVDGISGPFTVEISDTTGVNIRPFILAPVFITGANTTCTKIPAKRETDGRVYLYIPKFVVDATIKKGPKSKKTR